MDRTPNADAIATRAAPGKPAGKRFPRRRPVAMCGAPAGDPGMATAHGTSALALSRHPDRRFEMASSAKAAALPARNFRDSVVVAGVDETERRTTGLSPKIWRKIMILKFYGQAVAGATTADGSAG